MSNLEQRVAGGERLTTGGAHGGSAGLPGKRLAWSQQRLWLEHHADARLSAYIECPRHVPLAARLQGPLDVAVLARALRAVVRRHGSLRSCFPSLGGRPARLVLPASTVPVRCADLSARTPRDRDRRVAHLLQSDVCTPFDLARGPLTRIRVIKCAPDEHRLSVIIHHIVFDGWSKHVLWQELWTIYRAIADGVAPLRPAVSYDDYVNRESRRLATAAGGQAVAFWRSTLAGAPELRLPADGVPPHQASTRAGRAPLAIDPGCVDRVRTLARDHGVTAAVAMTAVFVLWLHAVTRARDIAIGLPIADRNHSDVGAVIGLCLNVLVLRTALSPDEAFASLLQRVRIIFMDAYARAETPYWGLPRREPAAMIDGEAPLRVVFNYVVVRELTPVRPGVSVEPVEVEVESPSHADLSVHLFDRPGHVAGFTLYKADLFSPLRIGELAAAFHRVIDRATLAPGSDVGSIVAGVWPPA